MSTPEKKRDESEYPEELRETKEVDPEVYLLLKGEKTSREQAREDFDELLKRAAKPKK